MARNCSAKGWNGPTSLVQALPPWNRFQDDSPSSYIPPAFLPSIDCITPVSLLLLAYSHATALPEHYKSVFMPVVSESQLGGQPQPLVHTCWLGLHVRVRTVLDLKSVTTEHRMQAFSVRAGMGETPAHNGPGRLRPNRAKIRAVHLLNRAHKKATEEMLLSVSSSCETFPVKVPMMPGGSLPGLGSHVIWQDLLLMLLKTDDLLTAGFPQTDPPEESGTARMLLKISSSKFLHRAWKSELKEGL